MQPYPYHSPQIGPPYQEMQPFQVQPVCFQYIRSDPSSSFVPKHVLDNVRRQYGENLIRMESGYSNEIHRRDMEIHRLNTSLQDLQKRVYVLEETMEKFIDNTQISSKKAVRKKSVLADAKDRRGASHTVGRINNIWSYFTRHKK